MEKVLAVFVLLPLLAIGGAFVNSFLIWYGWGYVAPLFHLPELTLWQSFCLSLVAHSLIPVGSSVK